MLQSNMRLETVLWFVRSDLKRIGRIQRNGIIAWNWQGELSLKCRKCGMFYSYADSGQFKGKLYPLCYCK